jgi:hypothetical protein
MMKVDLQAIDLTQFYVNERVLNGEVVYLVIPQQIGAKWTRENKCFRSSVWTANGELISAGFPKFTNWGENPEVFPLPETLTGATIMEKLDGSLLIVSKWKGQFILRTRGTIDATELDNGYELDAFKKTILPVLAETNLQINSTVVNASDETWGVSWLFEWTSPVQKIILNYGDQPQWHLVGMVIHKDYSLVSQQMLDTLAKALKLNRPATYTFTSIEDLLANVDQWKGKEGVVIYSPVGLHKVKSAWYLALHHMKSELASFDKVIDVWISMGMPDYQTFYNNIVTQFDFELADQCRGDLSRICDGYKEVKEIIAGFTKFINETLLPLGNPKDKKVRGQMAAKVFGAYGKTNRATFIFSMLDGRELGTDDVKKLLYQVLK